MAERDTDTVHFQNYFRLNVLLTTQGCGILREHFRQRYKCLTKKEWVDGSEECKEFLWKQMNGSGSLKHFPKIQKSMLETGDSGKWDITVLSSLLTKINYGLFRSAEVYEKFKEQNKQILLLTELRNKLAHLPDKVLVENEFINFWREAEKVLVVLGVPWQDVENIRTGSGLAGIELKECTILKENRILATNLCEEGAEAMKSGNIAMAVLCFEKALAFQGLPDSVRGILFSNRSHCYMKLLGSKEFPTEGEVFELTQLAFEDARTAIQLQPNWWRGYLRAARVYQYRKEWQAANILLTRAVELNPSLQGVVIEEEEYQSVGSSRIEIHEEKNDNLTAAPKIDDAQNNQNMEDRKSSDSAGVTGRDVEAVDQKPSDLEAGSAENASVAHCNIKGNGVPTDLNTEVSYLCETASSIDSAERVYNLGLMHLNGFGVPKDVKVALEYFEKAAQFPKNGESERNFGVAEAKFILGKCYEEGIGKPKDIAQSIVWYSRASKEGMVDATKRLARLYSKDGMVEKDYSKAMNYWIVAAGRGDVSAMFTLALEYLKRSKFLKAEDWFCRFVKTGKATDSEKIRYKKAVIAAQLKAKSQKETSGCLKASRMKVLKNDASNAFSTESEFASDGYFMFGKCFDTENLIREKAQIPGNLYTQKLLSSMEVYVNAMSTLGDFMKSGSQLKKAERRSVRNSLLVAFSNCFREINVMSFKMPHEFQKELEKITEEVMYGTAQYKSDQDKNARVIRSKFLRASVDQSIEFIKLSIEKYPKEEYFYEMCCRNLLVVGLNEDGMKIAKAAATMFPSNHELQFLEAEHIRCGIMSEKVNKSKNRLRRASFAYQNFMKIAPIDHPLNPQALYGLAAVLFWLEKVAEGEEYFKRALEKENNFIPCFFNEASSCKLLCQTLYSEIKSEVCVDSSTKVSRSDTQVNDTSDYYTQETENKSEEEESDCRSESEYPKDSSDSADYSEETDSVSTDADNITQVVSNQSQDNGYLVKESSSSMEPETRSWRSVGTFFLASTLLVSMWFLKAKN